MSQSLRAALIMTLLCMPLAPTDAVSQESEWWIIRDFKSSCYGVYAMRKWQFTIWRHKDSGPRVKVKKIVIHMEIAGEKDTKTCSDADHCDWLIEEYNLGCRTTCAKAVVEDYDGSLTTHGRECLGD